MKNKQNGKESVEKQVRSFNKKYNRFNNRFVDLFMDLSELEVVSEAYDLLEDNHPDTLEEIENISDFNLETVLASPDALLEVNIEINFSILGMEKVLSLDRTLLYQHLKDESLVFLQNRDGISYVPRKNNGLPHRPRKKKVDHTKPSI